MTYAKLWHDFLIGFHMNALCICTRFGLLAHKSFVKWVLGPSQSPARGHCNVLTNFRVPLDKMVSILADDNFKCIVMNEKLWISIQISLTFVPRGPIDYNSALFHVVAWHRTGDNPLPEPMLTQFINAYMQPSLNNSPLTTGISG